MRLSAAELWGSRRAIGGLAASFAVAALALLAGTSARGDIFHLSSGGRLEGELVEEGADWYRIQTILGLLRLTKDSVVRIEPAPSPFQEYRHRQAAATDTSDAQFALAAWCEENGLVREARAHLRRALELDPDHALARRKLGYVRAGELWVEARTVVERGRPAGAEGRDLEPAEDAARLAVAIQAAWRRQIKAIKSGLLDSPLPRHVEDGRGRILQIDDPLAVVPLVEVLSAGSPVCREVLIEVLRGFPDDVATVNLAALALAEPDRELRGQVIAELVQRKDPRVTAQCRRALASDDEIVIRRAAEVLGRLKATDAVPELIELLTARRWKRVPVPLGSYFRGLRTAFPVQNRWLGSTMVMIEPAVGIDLESAGVVEFYPERRIPTGPTSGVWIGYPHVVQVSPPVPVYSRLRQRQAVQEVTVYRTEVREALKQITGQDFGFHRSQWLRWYEEHQP